MTPSDRDLDRVLAGKGEADEQTAALAEEARRLEQVFAVDAPDAPGTRAVFASAVAMRRRPTIWRFVTPAIAVTSLMVAVYFAGRAATPGQPLWPVRKALQQVDLAPATSDQVQARVTDASRAIAEAERVVEESPRRARLLATEALKRLGAAEALVDDLPTEQGAVQTELMESLETRALAVLLLSFEEDGPEAIEERAEEIEDEGNDGDDNSGTGSDDFDSDDGSGDSSGSGSDDSGNDDSSGTGSGSDDSSGSGSGDDGSGGGSGSDDSSGSGSGSNDNSGSGSG